VAEDLPRLIYHRRELSNELLLRAVTGTSFWTIGGAQLPVTKIEFTLEAELTLQEVVLQIRNGKIMAIHAGSVKGKGELLLE